MAKRIPLPVTLLRRVITVLVFAMTPNAGADGEVESATAPVAPFSEQYTMLYYQDIAAARKFYGDVLGLEPTFNDQWVTLYRYRLGSSPASISARTTST